MEKAQCGSDSRRLGEMYRHFIERGKLLPNRFEKETQ